MCWDYETSVSTFILGTLANVYNIYTLSASHPEIIPISLTWQWTLMMQVFEAMAWKGHPDSASLAMMANVTQPIFTALAFLAFIPEKTGNLEKQIVVSVVFVYIGWLILQLNRTGNFNTLKPKEGCKHLNLGWWNEFQGNALPYLITLAIVITLLLRPVGVMKFTNAYVFGSLIISWLIYTCGTGSMWCWLAAFAPIATNLYYRAV